MSNFDIADQGGITADGLLAAAVRVDEVSNGLGLTVGGTFSATVQARISFDGTTFFDFGSPITTPSYLALPPCHTVDLSTSSYVSGTAVWQLGGLRSVDD